MTEIKKKAVAGTMESSDAYVEIEPAKGLELQIESVVQAQFGDSIKASAEDILNEYGVKGAKIRIVDQGALDCVIRARVETAIRRGAETPVCSEANTTISKGSEA